ncbi:Uncharacterised protein [Vibrio cholerae]|nr:Uncharacterised protein [Vibrio cholerae]CSI69757.1 Uncharacterised protein [Vibrio cholerae]
MLQLKTLAAALLVLHTAQHYVAQLGECSASAR